MYRTSLYSRDTVYEMPISYNVGERMLSYGDTTDVNLGEYIHHIDSVG